MLVWLIILSLQLMLSPIVRMGSAGMDSYLQVLPLILVFLACVVIFYINYYILIPRYFFPAKYGRYSVGAILCLAFVFIAPMFAVPFAPPLQRTVPMNAEMERTLSLAFTNTLFMILLTFFASTGLQVNARWQQAEKERLSAQIAYLKTQINPHFLFNVLNSIYAVTIGKAPQGAEMVEKLSEMMRYTLRETQMDFVPVAKEVEYISNYIDLQKVRLDDGVRLEYLTVGVDENCTHEVAPLLLIPFVENAFKHGVNAEQSSSIKIYTQLIGGELHLNVTNNKVVMDHDFSEKSGLGIETTRKRLELIYPNRHLLTIHETDSTFNVSLHINLQ